MGDLNALVEADEGINVPDYSNISLDELEDETDVNTASKDGSIHVPGYGQQGGYDAELDWNRERSVLSHDNFFTKNALMRRALLAGAKGAAVGMFSGGLLSLFCIKYMTLTHKVPATFHVYTVGGLGFMCGGMNAVHQARRYREYIGFKQSGMANPEMIGLKDAKNQMADWMASAYSPEYVEQWKESEEAEQGLQRQMAGIK